jgi:hypothetical protein
MNVRLLRRIAKRIQEKPREFSMLYYTGLNLPGKCKTTHCIGGWARHFTGLDPGAALDLTVEQEPRLFYVSGWPKQFQGRRRTGREDYQWYPTTKQTAARIEHFIKTKGAE